MKVFYSWQSDLPEKSNRFFILDCLRQAIRSLNKAFDIESASRDGSAQEKPSIELDHDTQGVPGIPDIASTIFDKIRNCDLFVADLSFVGKSSNGRLIPNPNVLIELGLAVESLGSERILLIMDEAHGAGSELPFDIRYRRHPILFKSDSLPNKLQKEQLTKNLQYALKLHIKNNVDKGKAVELPANASLEQILNSINNSDSNGDWLDSDPGGWRKLKVFKRNTNLRFEMNYDGVGVQKESFKEEWANRFPASDATGYWCDLHYGSTVLMRFILVSVDGGRALLPVPKSRIDLAVNALNYRVAKIHDSGSLDQYMRIAGLHLE
jgi:hypothetical protein